MTQLTVDITQEQAQALARRENITIEPAKRTRKINCVLVRQSDPRDHLGKHTYFVFDGELNEDTGYLEIIRAVHLTMFDGTLNKNLNGLTTSGGLYIKPGAWEIVGERNEQA